MVLLQLSNLSLSVGSTLLLEGVNALLTQGQRVALVGANGSGKSTLLRALTRPHNTYYLVGSGSITGTLGSATRGLDDDDNCADDTLLVEQDVLQVLRPLRFLLSARFDTYSDSAQPPTSSPPACSGRGSSACPPMRRRCVDCLYPKPLTSPLHLAPTGTRAWRMRRSGGG